MAVITSVVNGSICLIYPTIKHSTRCDGLVVITSAVNGKVGIILKLTLIKTIEKLSVNGIIVVHIHSHTQQVCHLHS